MGLQRQREERRTIMLQARLRADDGWCEATIANVSPRGVMIRCASPPERSNVVEIRHRGLCIVGRVMWSRGSRCGIRTQDPIDIDSLLAKSPITTTKKTTAEWRAVSPQRAKAYRPSLAVQSDASKQTARFLDWIVIATAGAVAAAMVASAADSFLGAPLSRASDALSQRGD